MGHSLHELGDLRSKVFLEIFPGCPGVLQGIVEESGNDRGKIRPEIGEDP